MTNENTTTKAPKEPKGRVFTFLLYKDSAPDDFVELLTAKQDLPVAISPLHDKDKAEGKQLLDEDYIKEYNGFKKPHYHGIIVSNGPLTAGAIRKRLQNVLGDKAVGLVQIGHSVKGLYEYLTHESVDAVKKNKHVYPKEDIVHINNFDIARYVTVSADERKQNMNIVIDLICTYNLCNVIQLREFVIANPDCGIDWAAASDVVDARGLTLRMYFDGVYQEGHKNQQDRVLRMIGEMHDQVQELWTCTSGLRRAERKARSRSTRQRARAKRVKGARA